LGIVCKKNFRGEVFGESVRERAGKMSGNVREELFVGMCGKISWGVSGGIVWGNVREKRLGMSEEIVRGNCPSGNMREKSLGNCSGGIVRGKMRGKCLGMSGGIVQGNVRGKFLGMSGENGKLFGGIVRGRMCGEYTWGMYREMPGNIWRNCPGMCEENTWGIVWGIVWGMSWSNVPGYVRIAMR